MKESANRLPMELARPDEILDGVAASAWQAFNAMETTKRRHFEFLEILDEKKKNFNIDPTDADRSRLACLLKDHDEQVRRFTKASQELKSESADAHTALFVYIGAIGDAKASTPLTH